MVLFRREWQFFPLLFSPLVCLVLLLVLSFLFTGCWMTTCRNEWEVYGNAFRSLLRWLGPGLGVNYPMCQISINACVCSLQSSSLQQYSHVYLNTVTNKSLFLLEHLSMDVKISHIYYQTCQASPPPLDPIWAWTAAGADLKCTGGGNWRGWGHIQSMLILLWNAQYSCFEAEQCSCCHICDNQTEATDTAVQPESRLRGPGDSFTHL